VVEGHVEEEEGCLDEEDAEAVDYAGAEDGLVARVSVLSLPEGFGVIVTYKKHISPWQRYLSHMVSLAEITDNEKALLTRT
jgi:hypothetical protein